MTNLEMIEKLDKDTYNMTQDFLKKGITQNEIDLYVTKGVTLYLLLLKEYGEDIDKHIENGKTVIERLEYTGGTL
ncbi:hypothetical protein LM99_0039 [Enterococcus phage vB_EfaS_LM99]|nr:hypothetical protein LM99_0039 [Enterococcus phage vB_EfaS_LM99]